MVCDLSYKWWTGLEYLNLGGNMDFKIIGVVFLIFALIYEKIWRKRVCETKIKEHIVEIGGEIRCIEKLSAREEIYNVKYVLNEEKEATTVKFNFFYDENWY